MDLEQSVVLENQISLSEKKDDYGRKTASIRWSVTPNDIENIQASARNFLGKWPGLEAGMPALTARKIRIEGNKSYDAYHPVGTCRMGNLTDAVVDFDLKVWGLQNVWVASTGVLPSAGSANPTFTMLCLTQKLAEQLISDSD